MDTLGDVLVAENVGEIIALHDENAPSGGAARGHVRIILCESGSFRLSVNGRVTRLRARDMLICTPGVGIVPEGSLDGGRAKMLALSYTRFLQSIRTVRNIWTMLMSTRSNPVFPLSDSDARLTLGYYEVIKGKLATQRDIYFDEIMQSLVQCAILEICVIVGRSMGDGLRESQMSRKDLLFKRFLELLSEHGGRERSLSAYADKLCVTPKYLSSVCTSVCGISAHEMILREASQQISLALEHSTLSIKEIAAEFLFPDISSFGKFVRTRLGKSPRGFRQ